MRRVRYYLDADRTLYRRTGSRIEFFSRWHAAGWVPFLLPLRIVATIRRISWLRAATTIGWRRFVHWRYERAVGVR